MTDTEKTESLEQPNLPDPVDAASEPSVSESEGTEEKEVGTDFPEEKSRRAVVAGLMVAAVLSLVAVLFGGVFQLASRRLVKSPKEPPVSERSVTLWKDLISDKAVPRPLGVQEKWIDVTKFKIPEPATSESKEEEQKDH
jgi:hypothetical protein